MKQINLTGDQARSLREILKSQNTFEANQLIGLFPVNKIDMLKAVRQAVKDETGEYSSLRDTKDFVDRYTVSLEKRGQDLVNGYHSRFATDTGNRVPDWYAEDICERSRYDLEIDYIARSRETSRAHGSMVKAAAMIEALQRAINCIDHDLSDTATDLAEIAKILDEV
jgi:hypothetical protein